MSYRPIHFLSFFFLFSSTVFGEIGVVNPSEWNAKFESNDISRAIFCVKKSVRSNNDHHCATAFLISKEGHVLTAHHVERFPRVHGSNQDKRKKIPGSEILVDQLGQTYTYDIIHYPSSDEINQRFLEDVDSMRREEFLIMGTADFKQKSIVSKIDPEHYEKMDAIVLKIRDIDLGKLNKLGAEPLKVRLKPLVRGERLFLAGYPWSHYKQDFFKLMRGRIKKEEGKEYPALRPSNGDFAFSTGKFSSYQGLSILTRAGPDQEAGTKINTDAIDSVPGNSGSPVIDQYGQVVGIHWGSDSSLGNFAPIRRSLITFAVDIRKVYERFQLNLLDIKIGEKVSD